MAAKLSGSVTEIERLGSEVARHGAAVEQIAVRRATDEQALQALEAELRKTPREARRSERQALERRAGALRDAQALAREAAAASERVDEALRRSATGNGAAGGGRHGAGRGGRGPAAPPGGARGGE